MIINQKYLNSQPQIQSLEELANHIKDGIVNNEPILLFNNIILSQAPSAQFLSLKLLKHLRIVHQIDKPIIVVGFLPLQYILSNHPEHSILTSPGARYLQLPYTDEALTHLKMGLKPIKNVKKVLKPFVKADFKIEQFGHSFANRFGLYHLEEQHKKVKPTYLSKAEFSEIEIYEFKKALFIYQKETTQPPVFPIVLSNSKSRLLYIDDQADGGWSHLLQSIIGFNDNLKLKKLVPNTEDDFINEIKEKIKEHRSTGVILDLRLKGDKEKDVNVLNTSGYEVLEMIKRNFPSLPVLIFSATNKAASLKELLDAGALNLYTKPRIEENHSIANCYNDLIERLNELVNFYKYEEEKVALESDYLLDNLNKNDLTISLVQYVQSFDCIMTDTNCWMMNVSERHSVTEISFLYKWLYLTSFLHPDAFTLIVEIQRELLVHQYTNNTKKTETELTKNAITASYGLQLTNKIVKNQKLFVYDLHKINAFGKRFQFNYEIENDILYQECKEYNKPLFKVALNLNLGDDANATLKSLNKRRFLYADDAFVNIIYNHIENPRAHYRKLNVLLLSEDVGCMDNIHRVFIHKYPTLSVTDITINKTMSEDRVQEAILRGLNSFSQSFSITLVNPFKYVKKVINLSQS